MIQKMRVEAFDGKSKIMAELDVVKQISNEKVIVHLFSNFYKELTFQPDQNFWKVTKEEAEGYGGNINQRTTKRKRNSGT
jgi:hypothetical protein